MCVAFWTLDDPDYALIMCANRDEYLARPTHPAAFHSFDDADGDADADAAAAPRVLSGRDAQAGGTWLGLVPDTGRVALLTNITERPDPAPLASRGVLAPAFLRAPPRTPLAQLFPPAAQYAGFNLLVLEAARAGAGARTLRFAHAALVSNGGARGRIAARDLRADERACGGLSNGVHVLVDDAGAGAGEAWPKVAEGRALFAAALAEARAEFSAGPADGAAADRQLARRLLRFLRTPPAEAPRAQADLRGTICVPPMVRPVAGVAQAHYATRTATVLLVRRSGAALFVERDVWRLAQGGGVELNEDADVDEGAGEGGAGTRMFRVQVGAPE